MCEGIMHLLLGTFIWITLLILILVLIKLPSKLIWVSLNYKIGMNYYLIPYSNIINIQGGTMTILPRNTASMITALSWNSFAIYIAVLMWKVPVTVRINTVFAVTNITSTAIHFLSFLILLGSTPWRLVLEIYRLNWTCRNIFNCDRIVLWIEGLLNIFRIFDDEFIVIIYLFNNYFRLIGILSFLFGIFNYKFFIKNDHRFWKYC